jgi:exopolyphosphatase/guanosine-5'-triphosphate,3'-diphosphate pyrophosphatase
VIDIGGGSSEIICGTPNDITEATSLDIGAVRLTERFLKHAPPLDNEVHEMETWLGQQLSALSSPGTDARLIGVAGTVTSRAALDLGLAAFDRDAIAGHVLRVKRVESLYKELCRRSPTEIRTMSRVMTGREDIITAGTCILLGVMKRLGFDSVTVSERGIRYGLALRELAGRRA